MVEDLQLYFLTPQTRGSDRKRMLTGIFRNLRKLTRLDLSDNFLSSLDRDLFASLESLEVLDLSKNELRSLPDGLFQAR